jgi:phosphopantothenoylcysteine decarboxylase
MMWENPATARHLRMLAEEAAALPPPSLALPELLAWINGHCPRLRVVAPVSKRLACDDVGVGALADREQILECVIAACGLARR